MSRVSRCPIAALPVDLARQPPTASRALQQPRLRRGLSGGSLDDEAGYASEDAIVRDERYAEAERRRRDPTIRVVLALSQGMPCVGARGAEPGIDLDQLRAAVNHLDVSELGLKLEQPRFARASGGSAPYRKEMKAGRPVMIGA